MSNQTNSMNKGLTVKDLVTTGIFTALVFVFILVGGILFAPNPVLTFFMPAGSGLLTGPVFLLMIAKVQKRWSLSIMGVVICIIWFVTGMHCGQSICGRCFHPKPTCLPLPRYWNCGM